MSEPTVFILVIIILIILYLEMPISPVEKEYLKLIGDFDMEHIPQNQNNEFITENDLMKLPKVLRLYYLKNGYMGVKKVSKLSIRFKKASFTLKKDMPKFKINYFINNYVEESIRISYFNMKRFGIPFEGIDKNIKGSSNLYIKCCKHIKIFKNSIRLIDAASIIDIILHPCLALSKYISYKELDSNTMEVTVTCNSSKITGIIYFNKLHEARRIVVNDRFCVESNSYEKWTVELDDYKIINGIHIPTSVRTVWNLKDGDLVNFEGENMRIDLV